MRTIYGMIKVKLKESKKISSAIWSIEKDQKYKGERRMSYVIKHIPSNSYVPRTWLGAAASDSKSVKAIIKLLNDQAGNWVDIADQNPSKETYEAVYKLIQNFKTDKIEHEKPKTEALTMINEALTGLMLPSILNTKVMESISLSGMAQETFGRFVRDWVLNWGQNTMAEVTKAITMNLDSTRKLMKPVFFRFYENNGGNKKDLSARKDYYAFTHEAWQERLRSINLTGMMGKKLAEWRADLVRALGPGQNNDVDAEILDKTLDNFIEMKNFLQEQGSNFYSVANQGPDNSIDSKGSNYSHIWPQHRRILKSVRKYLEKRDIPMIWDWVEHQYNQSLLYAFNSMNRSRNVVKLRKWLNENEKNWVDIDKLLKDPGSTYNSETGEGLYKDSIDAIADFLKTAKYREAYTTMCSDGGEGEIAPKGKPCIIKKYDDGYVWFSRGAKSCELFGQEGRNCGQGKYTLIDLQKIRTRHGQTKRFWRIGLDYDVDGRVLHQILGASNQFPSQLFWTYIKDFIDTYDVQNISSNAFQYLTDNDEVSDDEVLEFIMAVGNEPVKSKWIERKEKKERSGEGIIEFLTQRTVAGGGIMGYEQHPDVLRWTGGGTFYDRRRVGPATAQRWVVRHLNDFEENGLDSLTQLEIAQINTIVEIYGFEGLRLDSTNAVQLYNQLLADMSDGGPTEEDRNWRAGMPTPANESMNRWKRNLNYQPPKKIDAKKAHAVQSWYKKQKERLK